MLMHFVKQNACDSQLLSGVPAHQFERDIDSPLPTLGTAAATCAAAAAAAAAAATFNTAVATDASSAAACCLCDRCQALRSASTQGVLDITRQFCQRHHVRTLVSCGTFAWALFASVGGKWCGCSEKFAGGSGGACGEESGTQPGGGDGAGGSSGSNELANGSHVDDPQQGLLCARCDAVHLHTLCTHASSSNSSGNSNSNSKGNSKAAAAGTEDCRKRATYSTEWWEFLLASAHTWST
jgi:hypothetical protein